MMKPMAMRALLILVIAFSFVPATAYALDGIFPGQNSNPVNLITDIPAFQNVRTGEDMPAFLNSLYTICIGAAVVIAILQLIRGGITWMLADSLTSKESARHSITIAIMGLILVLSPYIVFSIINPKILDLSITKLTLTVPEYRDSPQTPIEGGGELVENMQNIKIAVFGTAEQAMNYQCPVGDFKKDVLDCNPEHPGEICKLAVCRGVINLVAVDKVEGCGLFGCESQPAQQFTEAYVKAVGECRRLKDILQTRSPSSFGGLLDREPTPPTTPPHAREIPCAGYATDPTYKCYETKYWCSDANYNR